MRRVYLLWPPDTPRPVQSPAVVTALDHPATFTRYLAEFEELISSRRQYTTVFFDETRACDLLYSVLPLLQSAVLMVLPVLDIVLTARAIMEG